MNNRERRGDALLCIAKFENQLIILKSSSNKIVIPDPLFTTKGPNNSLIKVGVLIKVLATITGFLT